MSTPYESRHKPMTIRVAITKLHDVSLAINRRGELKSDETKRAMDARNLLDRGLPTPGSKGEKNRTKYYKFLRKVAELCGQPMVVLAAAALGLSTVANMRDCVRLNLPFEVDTIKEDLLHSTLQDITNSLPQAPTQANEFPNSLQPSKQPAEKRNETLPGPDTPAHNAPRALTSRNPHSPQSVSLDLQLRDFVEFLQQYEESKQQLQMECPFSGDPLPFIRFAVGQQVDLHAKLEFSQPLATLFIQYVMNRVAA